MSKHDAIWADDLLKRRCDAEFLEVFLCGKANDRKAMGRTGSYVLNIDAAWGAGKSFFLQRLAQHLEANSHVVARVNAWKDDHVDDPFVAVLAAIDEALKPFVKKGGKLETAWTGVKSNAVPILGKLASGVTKTLVKKYVGKEAVEAISELASAEASDGGDVSIVDQAISGGVEAAVVQIETIIDAGAQKLIDAFTERNKASETFKQKLGDAVAAIGNTHKPPLFVFIDELDRCRPSYAIALLERVKHLFDADNVVFVFATNSAELQHIVAGAYGPSFDGLAYLKRFFDRTYLLANPDIDTFLRAEVASLSLDKIRTPRKTDDFFAILFSSYGSNLREIKQAMDLMSSVISAWRHTNPIEMTLLGPLTMSFLRRSSVDTQIAHSLIPSSFSIPLGARTNYDTMRSQTVYLDVATVFQDATELMQDLRKASDNGGARPSPEVDYVGDIFMPEWNGRAVRAGQASIQADLPRLIAYAGKFVAASE